MKKSLKNDRISLGMGAQKKNEYRERSFPFVHATESKKKNIKNMKLLHLERLRKIEISSTMKGFSGALSLEYSQKYRKNHQGGSLIASRTETISNFTEKIFSYMFESKNICFIFLI